MTEIDNYKEAAKLRGEKRSSDVERRVQEAMVTITAEMKANGGIYPKNGGAVSMNEVARRAGIHATTLHTQKQSQLGERVKFWVVSLKKKEVVGRMRVRRTFAERAEGWKARYEAFRTATSRLSSTCSRQRLSVTKRSLTLRNCARITLPSWNCWRPAVTPR